MTCLAVQSVDEATIKAMTQYEATHGPDDNRRHIMAVFGRMFGSAEAAHGIGSFMRKQKPEIRDRS